MLGEWNGWRIKRRVWVGLAVLVVGAASGWLWLGIDGVGDARLSPQAAAFVRVAGVQSGAEDQALQARSEYFDPAPLFLPTVRNFNRGQIPAALAKQPGQVFQDFGAKSLFVDGRLNEFGALNPTAAEELIDVVAKSSAAPFAGLGEASSHRSSLVKRVASIRLTEFGGNWVKEIPVIGADAPVADFAPLEFHIVVGAAGLIGDPILALSSGQEDLDSFFREYFRKDVFQAAHLRPGRYRVVVGP